VARDVAGEEIGTGLAEIGGPRVGRAGVEVVAVPDLGDAGAVLDDIAVGVDRVWDLGMSLLKTSSSCCRSGAERRG
jgi:hypothetical protein